MNKASKLLVAVAAASGIAAYIVNKFGSSKKDDSLYEEQFNDINNIEDVMNMMTADTKKMSYEDIMRWNIRYNTIDWGRVGNQSNNREFLTELIKFKKNEKEQVEKLARTGEIPETWMLKERMGIDHVIAEATDALARIRD